MKVFQFPLSEEHIRIKKPMCLGKKQIFNIYYTTSETEHDLIIQTPSVILPYGYMYSQEDNSIQFDCCNDVFVSYIENLEEFVKQKIVSYDKRLLDGKTHLNKLKPKDYGKIFRCRVKDRNDILLFDQQGHQLNVNELKPERKIQMILWVKWIWVSDSYYGIEYTLLQIKIYMPPKVNLFIEDNQYEKYDKMLKLKIPKGAVESKMKLDGICQDEIDEYFTNKVSKEDTVAKPISQTNLFKNPLSFLGQIASGDFKLKKTVVDKECEKKKIMNKISKYVDTSRKVPTLDEIVSAREKLRKLA